jgi:hypothetical protein
MKASDLLKEIREDQRDKALEFITTKPPHPAELGALEESVTFEASDKSIHDQIVIHRARQPKGNHVSQEIMAVGAVAEGEGTLNTMLGTWGMEEFTKRKAPSGPELN